MRFNPCEPIHYVVNAALAPPGAVDDLQEAIRRLEAATGLTFVNDGPTDERAEVSRPRAQPERYGPRWAPGPDRLGPRRAVPDGRHQPRRRAAGTGEHGVR